MKQQSKNVPPQQNPESDTVPSPKSTDKSPPEEIGGVKGPEPTRFGDWEKNGRCIDF